MQIITMKTRKLRRDQLVAAYVRLGYQRDAAEQLAESQLRNCTHARDDLKVRPN